MIRSIFNRSILAATCVLALGQTANASIQNMDPNDSRTKAGAAYTAAKRSGETCPLAAKVALNASTAATKSVAAVSNSGSSSFGGRNVR